jgi:hypothetical protein
MDKRLADLVLESNTVCYRDRLNSMLNLRLVRLGVPLSIREYLEPDSTDEEWCRLFSKYIADHLCKE